MWRYNLVNGNAELEIYDHTDTLIRTLTNSGEGFAIPGDILKVMDEEAMAVVTSGGSLTDTYVLQTLRHAAFELIEEGQP